MKRNLKINKAPNTEGIARFISQSNELIVINMLSELRWFISEGHSVLNKKMVMIPRIPSSATPIVGTKVKVKKIRKTISMPSIKSIGILKLKNNK